MEEKKEGEVLVDPIILRDERIAKLEEERDNYKNVALKRLGKLPGDADFMDEEASKSGLTVEEIVKNTLLEREIVKEKSEKDAEVKKILRENAELRLALKNRPSEGVGTGSNGTSGEVKDNSLSQFQIDQLNARAKKLGLDPVKTLESYKRNLAKH